jgi:hypothetical protein
LRRFVFLDNAGIVMNTHPYMSLKAALHPVAAIVLAVVPSFALAAPEDDFTYTDNGTTITVIGYATGAPTDVVIPGTIIGKPVTAIAGNAFANRTELKSVTIPEGVTSIGNNAFYGCSSMSSVALPLSVETIGNYAFYNCYALPSFEIPKGVTSIGLDVFVNCIALTGITVNTQNPNYSSEGGVLFNKTKTTLVAYPSGVSGGYKIPDGVNSIGQDAFNNCDKLTGVTVPATVAEFGNGAFYSCGSLAHVSFLGNAPTLGSYALVSLAPGFKIYRPSSATGFNVTPWSNYTQIVMGDPTPITDWLLSQGLTFDSDLQSDANSDGVNLLMAYALNLDPDQNQSGNLPQPVFGASQMSLTFYAGNADVTYAVEVSEDMTNWSTEGVALSDPDANQMRTATVGVTGTSRYMRLTVSH